MQVWTMVYEPFRMGGSLRNPYKAEIEPIEEHGFPDRGGNWRKIAVLKNPELDHYLIVCGESGGVVGSGWDKREAILSVMKDIFDGDYTIIDQQIAESSDMRDRALERDADWLWHAMRGFAQRDKKLQFKDGTPCSAT